MGNIEIFQLWQKHLVSNIAHNKKEVEIQKSAIEVRARSVITCKFKI